MRAESVLRDDGRNIPHTGITVNAVVCEALAGSGVRVRALGLDVAKETSIPDLVTVCGKLFRLGSKMSLSVQFCLGDAHAHTPSYSAARRELENGVEREYGASYADRLRGFGSVAKRWPKDRRSDKYCWQYYKDNDPGRPGKPDVPRAKKPIRLKEISSAVVDGVEVLRCEGRGGQVYEVERTSKL